MFPQRALRTCPGSMPTPRWPGPVCCDLFTPCRMGRLSTMVGCSSSSSAAGPRRCGCCCTTASTDPRAGRDHRLRPRPEPLGRHLEHLRARRRARPALSLPGRRARSSPSKGQRFDGTARLIDPYAKALAGDFLPADDGIVRPPKCVVVDDEFDWQGDRHLRRSLAETVIYEMHVRGFTRAESSGVEHPGTYLGLIEKIPYLQSLGVTAVELMPVHEFPIERLPRADARRGRTTGATIRWRSSRRTAATPSAASRAARSASSRRWCWPCTGRASR